MTSSLPYRPCVGLALFNRQGLVFCGERHDTPGAWQMPQGGVQAGEDPAAAATRELKEEIGVSRARIIGRSASPLRYDFPQNLVRHQLYKGKYRGQEQTWFALLFEGSDDEIDLVSHNDAEGPEFGAWRWVELAEAPGLIVEFKRPVYEAVAAEFAPLVRALKGGML